MRDGCCCAYSIVILIFFIELTGGEEAGNEQAQPSPGQVSQRTIESTSLCYLPEGLALEQ